MAIVAVPKPLREKLGEEGVDALIELFNQSQSEQKNNMLEFVEEKFERRLAEEMKIIDRRISETEARLDGRISQSNANLIRWMFIFWVGQVGVIIGILFAFFK